MHGIRLLSVPFWVLLAFVTGCAGTETPPPADVDADRLLNADSEPGNWLAHGRTYDEQRHSPLSGITPDNVAELGLTWYYDFETARGMEATPIVVDWNVMFVSSNWSIGSTRWTCSNG